MEQFFKNFEDEEKVLNILKYNLKIISSLNDKK